MLLKIHQRNRYKNNTHISRANERFVAELPGYCRTDTSKSEFQFLSFTFSSYNGSSVAHNKRRVTHCGSRAKRHVVGGTHHKRYTQLWTQGFSRAGGRHDKPSPSANTTKPRHHDGDTSHAQVT